MIHNFYPSLLDNILIFLLIYISFFYVVVGLAFVSSSNHWLGLKCSNIVQAIFILFCGVLKKGVVYSSRSDPLETDSEFNSGWTNTQGLKMTEEKVLPLS
mgnify:FL=1